MKDLNTEETYICISNYCPFNARECGSSLGFELFDEARIVKIEDDEYIIIDPSNPNDEYIITKDVFSISFVTKGFYEEIKSNNMLYKLLMD